MPLHDNISLIRQLKDGLSAESCQPLEPFIKLGTGQAPSLNYNVPQEASFTTYSPNFVKGIPQDAFLPQTKLRPPGSYFDVIGSLTNDQIQARLAQSVQLQRTDDPLADGSLLRKHLNDEKSDLEAASLSSAKPPMVPGSPLVQDNKNAVNEIQLADLASKQEQPMVIEKMGGFQTRVAIFHEPAEIVPYFAILEEYTTTAFLGDYGAGRTINTFSLLPGEKTTISVKTYRDSTTTKAFSENVLDSFSESSTNELEKNLENETGYTDTNTTGTSTTTGKTRAANVSANIGGALGKLISFGVNGGYNSGSSTSNTTSAASTRASNVRSVNKALDKHVATSNANRQVTVNSSTNETLKEGEETSNVRELINLNKSRVLNFVFRQLLQQYITITYLSNVRIVFCNGYKDSLQVVDVEELEKLLEDNLEPQYIETVRAKLLKDYCTIYNYKDERIDFIERKEFNVGRCVGLETTETFWRIKRNLTDSYLVNPTSGFSLSVPGPILNVQAYTLQTSSVIVDALLGQGEALDCYGMKTQDAGAIAEQLKNLSILQKMEVVDAITDPQLRAETYLKVFGTCCDTPQTQIIT